MARQLRPRKSAVSYRELAGVDVGIPPPPVDDGPDSGSDFAPERETIAVDEPSSEEGGEPAVSEEDEVDEIEEHDSDALSITTHETPKLLKSRKSLVSGTSRIASRPSVPLASAKRSQPALPSANHRHRAEPLFRMPGATMRLVNKPTLFGDTQLKETNNFTHSKLVTARMNRSWACNVGAGPIWELVEDRAWFKEACTTDGAGSLEPQETLRRPLVHSAVNVLDGWNILDAASVRQYLPTAPTATAEGTLMPPPPITCHFGSFGSQKRVDVDFLQVQAMAEFFPASGKEDESVVFNAGAPVWGLDWCPIYAEHRKARKHKQYLAVAPFPSSTHAPEIGVKTPRPSPASIQIWSFCKQTGKKAHPCVTRCEINVCHDSGPAHMLKWCPLPSDDDLKASSSTHMPRKLGLLAGIFEDGSFSIYAIPEPEDMFQHSDISPVAVYLPNPVLRIDLEEAACVTFDWANSEVVAIGTGNGVIAVYDIGKALISTSTSDSSTVTDLLPTHYLNVHQCAIRALAWIRVPPGSNCASEYHLKSSPTVIASGGYDGMECLTDIRDGRVVTVNRTRDVISCMAYTPYAAGPVTIDHENVIKIFSASPSTLGRGHSLLEPQGPIWDIGCSDYHPTLAAAGSDGCVYTTNMLKTSRKTGSNVPFFLHKIYQIDYSRETGEFRMLEKFLPIEARERAALRNRNGSVKSKKKKKDTTAEAKLISTATWPHQVSITRVCWNQGNGLSHTGMLASSSVSGLVRVDNIWGRWLNDRVPYTDIAIIRCEGLDGEVTEDDDELEDEDV